MDKRSFLFFLVVTLAFRLWLAVALPITGDEAYFIWWGKYPDWGFYDHPPMIGWWLAALLQLSDASVWLRMPALLLPLMLALATRQVLRPYGDALAWGGASLMLLTPLNVWNVIVTTDTALVFFSVLSALAWWRAARDDDPRWYLLAGVMLAGAVLSKYFVALLGFAYLVHALVRPNRRKWRGLLLCYGAVLPALALMIWWNSAHCWPNYMFNFVNRHESGRGLNMTTPLVYLGMMLYVLTPMVIYPLWQRRAALKVLWHSAHGQALLLMAGVPLLLFAGLSLVKMIGLHWMLSFLPLLLLLLPLVLDEAGMRRVLQWLAGFALLHMLVFVIVAQLPLETWQRTRLYPGLVLTVDGQGVLDQLRPYRQDYVFMSDGYSNAVTLGWQARRYFPVFGLASSHARHDDILTDFREFAGRNILVLRKTPPALGDYTPYFARVDVKEIEQRGARYYLVLGQAFDYPRYRDEVLTAVRQRYYRVPHWLPQTQCYFCERYFPEQPCASSP